MTIKHNKKRNVGIIYELLVRQITDCIIENNINGVRVVTSILEKRFNKNTELYKEFRLFNALAKTSVSNTEIAAGILTEAKNAARRCDQKKLNKEKSALIRDINYKIDDKGFYHRNIPDYTLYASIQTAINEWRKNDTSNLKKQVELEKKIIHSLIEDKPSETIEAINENLNESKSDKLVLKIMTEKINKKYKSMSKDQKEIIKNYTFYFEKDKEKLKSYLFEKKEQALDTLSQFKKSNDNMFINKKIPIVSENIKTLNTDDITEKNIIKFLTLTKLVSEINSGEK